MRLPDPCLPQPPGVDSLQIYGPFFSPGPDIRLHAAAECLPHGVGHIVVRLEAAGADARADGNADILRPRAEEPSHFSYRLSRQVQSSATPAGVDRTDGRRHRVVEQQDDAVRRKDHQVQPRLIGHQGISGKISPNEQSLAAVRGGHMADGVLMDLLGLDHVLDIRPQGLAEPAVIFQHAFPAVRVRAAPPEVQRGSVPLADAPQAGGEAVADGAVLQNI